MYWVKTPAFVKRCFPGIIWDIKNTEKVYLTFDDGPNPASTPQLLEKLSQHDIKATFFLTGFRASAHPDLVENIITEGHTIGSHGYGHISGWVTPFREYSRDVDKAAKITGSTMFRPPYGRLTLRQYRKLSEKYRIIMWDIMPGDFDLNCSNERCYTRITKNLSGGSIIVLHDSPRSIEKIEYCLDKMAISDNILFDSIKPNSGQLKLLDPDPDLYIYK